jgi:DMSO/TMAO reductase YedYZ molybdopterin-dependent catalytic subunit
VVAAGAALGTSELLSGLSDRVPSLVLGVAELIVVEAPGDVVRWSIGTLGFSQKTVLVVGIVVVSLLIGAMLGRLASRDFLRASAWFAAFGVFGGWAAARGPTGDAWLAWASAAASVAVGVSTLAIAVGPWSRPAERTATTSQASGSGTAAVDRRWFLAATSLAAAWAVVGGGVGRRLRESHNVEAARARVAARLGLRRPTVPAGVDTFDGEVAGVSPIVTPNRDFFRIDTRLLVPQVDPDDWSLRVTGMVDRELELSFDELLAIDRIDAFITLQCVSNEVGGDLVGNAWWSGVPLQQLLDRAGASPRASQIVGRSVDGWTAGFPTDVLADGRPCMVAIAMNGEPLPTRHGFPARLVIPGLYGYVSATKWLNEIELTTWEDFDGYWIDRGWAKEGPIKTQSRIDVPRSGSRIPAGATAVAGVAWAPTRSIDRVEVRVDDGPWRRARLSGALSEHTWVQWSDRWDATPGRHVLQVRATDGDGVTQTADKAPPEPSGATGYHTIEIDVVSG